MMSVLYIKTKDGRFQAIPMLQGANGASAYQIACQHGFDGSESEWLNSLQGENYILTEDDKQDIAQMAIDLIPTAEGVKY